MEISFSYRFGRKGISASTLYGNNTLGYGFVTDEVIAADPRLQIPEINSGFVKHDKCTADRIINLVDTEYGVKADYDGDGQIPVIFKAGPLPDTGDESKLTVSRLERSQADGAVVNNTFELSGSESRFSGNFKVRIEIYAEEDTEGLLFLGRRRLAVKRRFRVGETFTGSYVTNICPIIPRTFTEVMEDTSIDIALVGKGLTLVSAEISEFDGPTVYIAGDSTVTDQSAAYPYEPALSYSGWGQMLSAFCSCSDICREQGKSREGVRHQEYAVSNHAHSGLTTESMRSEGHYTILYDQIKKGDICLFQFGHNDQKLESLKAFEGYTANLKRYIDEIRAKEAIPVIISPLARNTWKGDGTYNDLLEEYARACETVARDNKVPYIDLHAFSMDFVTGNGRETARRWYYPSDYTHTNDYGAYLFAGYVYSELVRQGLMTGVSELPGIQEWLPPVELPVIRFPQEEGCDAADDKNAANNKSKDPVNSTDNDLFAELERPNDILTRAEAFEMVIKTVKFFPTNVYNDLFADVVGHETYAGIIECALQNGIIPESMIETVTVADTETAKAAGKDETAAGTPERIGSAEAGDTPKYIHPEKQVMLREFLAVLRLGYLSRRPEGDVFTKLDTAGLKDEDVITRAQAADICRQIAV